MRIRSYALSVILFLSLLATFAAWQMSRDHAQAPETRYRSANPPVIMSATIIADYQIAQELNRMPGVNGAAVLIKDGVAYVGTHVIGNEAKILENEAKSNGDRTGVDGTLVTRQGDLRGRDAMRPERSLYSGKGTAEQLARNNIKRGKWRPENPQAQAHAASETGDLDPQLKRQIETRVRTMNRSVTKVYITADYEKASELQGYARHIHNGSSITSYGGDFQSFIKRIWPDAAP